MKQEYAYWMALAHTERMRTARKNELIIRCYDKDMTLSDFFHSDPTTWSEAFELSEEEVAWLQAAKAELPNYSFVAEDLLEQEYEIIPITSSDYPRSLKQNLKKTYAPTLLYVKGNKELLQAGSVAIVGSRQAGNLSLTFTDNIAARAVKERKIIVSGYAKGVDKQALDSALAHGGSSIIILPQGITTFNSGYKTLYKEIISGRVLVVSTFQPQAPWNAGLAMARNTYIYGMGNEIYVAESDNKGGTWTGVIDGLRKKRKIYVRQPAIHEKNANQLLIEKGAIPVSLQGEICEPEFPLLCVGEDEAKYEGINERIRKILNGQKLSSKEIITRLGIGWSTRKMTSHLQKMEGVETYDQSPKRFAIKGYNREPTLF